MNALKCDAVKREGWFIIVEYYGDIDYYIYIKLIDKYMFSISYKFINNLAEDSYVSMMAFEGKNEYQIYRQIFSPMDYYENDEINSDVMISVMNRELDFLFNWSNEKLLNIIMEANL